MAEEFMGGEPIRASRPEGIARSPDEAIVGEGFTLIDAGLLGPLVGMPGPVQLAPMPRIQPQLQPRQQFVRPDTWMQEYMMGQEVPIPFAGGGVVSGGGTPLTVQEQDGTPSVTNVDLMKVPNGTLADLGGGDVSLNYESPINKNVANGYAGLDGSAPFAAGSVIFANPTGLLTQDNANLFWDNTNKLFNVGATFVADATNRRVGIDVGGTGFAPATAVHLRAQQDTAPTIRLDQYSNTGFVDWSLEFRRARGTIAAPLALADDDDLLGVFAIGHDGTAFATGGEFLAEAAGAWTSTSHGIRWVWKTTAQGSVAGPSDRMVLTDGGTLVLGTAVAPLGTEKLSVDGDVRLRGNFDILPSADNTGEVGTDALRFNRVRAVTVVTGDLELQDDEAGAHWTLREQPEAIMAVNRKTGKRYRLMLEELES